MLLGYYCAKLGDPKIVEAIRGGLDLHVESAKGALGVDEIETDEQRQVGKTLNYSLIYGGGRPTIKKQLGVSWYDAGKMLDGFHRQWPGVGLLTARINDTLDKRGYIKTPWGRHLHPRSRHSALNTLIQGTAAELKRQSMIEVHRFLREYRAHLVLEVHDELIVDTPEDEVHTVSQVVPVHMDYEPISRVIQIETDCEITRTNWAEKEPYVR